MAYTNHDSFLKEYYKVENTKIERGEKIFPSQHASVEDAWHLYTETFALKSMGVNLDGQPSQFFGRLVTDWQELLTANLIRLADLPVGIGDKEKQNFLTLDNYISRDKKKWTPLINDCWLLAGVNSLQQYYACSPLTWDNILHPTYAVTATGRELVGLTLAGYCEKAVSVDTKCFVHTIGKEEQARNLSLLAYDKQMSELSDQGRARNFFKNNSQFNID
jgi:hypothetical protein